MACGWLLSPSLVTAQEDADGLSDEKVTLNTIQAIEHFDDLPTAFVRTAQNPFAPLQRNDGIATGKLNPNTTDLALLNTLIDAITKGQHGNIDSLLIQHQNQLVFEQYWREGEIDTPHYVFSITKNMLSNAIGKAIEQGHIASLDDPAIHYLPELAQHTLTNGSERITLHDLLSMQSGFSITELSANDLKRNVTVNEHATLYFTMSDPIPNHKPFKYQGANNDVLNHILYNTTGLDVKGFTEKHFFAPMGIGERRWEPSLCGLTKASSGLFLTSRDMLKFGMLVMGKGQYNGKVLLSETWMNNATRPHTPNGKYGYFWWTEDFFVDGKRIKTISARGARGQFIFVMPELELVVVITSRNTGVHRRDAFKFVPESILPMFIKQS